MLEEVRIKILVKTVGKIDAGLLPLCLHSTNNLQHSHMLHGC